MSLDNIRTYQQHFFINDYFLNYTKQIVKKLG